MKYQMKISVSEEIGKILGSRPKAAVLREKLIELEYAVVDFSGVEVISHSFADELIGKLAGIFGKDVFKSKFQLINIPEDSRQIFYYVIMDNVKKSEAQPEPEYA